MGDSIPDVEFSNLDKLLGFGPSSPLTPQQEIDSIASKLIVLRAQSEELSSQIKTLENAIIVRTPDEPGDYTLEGERQSVMVSRSELWNWDSEMVASKIPTVPVPDFINVKYGVNRKMFAAQTTATQSDFLPALTRKPGAPRIKISDKA